MIEMYVFLCHWVSDSEIAGKSIFKQTFRFYIVTHWDWRKAQRTNDFERPVIVLFVCLLHCSNNSQR